MLVQFCAPWASFCIKMREQYKQAAELLSVANRTTGRPAMRLGMINGYANESKPLIEEFGIPGYPTFRVFRSGRVYDHPMPRDAVGIEQRMTELSRHPMSIFSTGADFNAHGRAFDIVIAGFFTSLDSANFKTYLHVAETVRHFAFYFSATVGWFPPELNSTHSDSELVMFKKTGDGMLHDKQDSFVRLANAHGEWAEHEVREFLINDAFARVTLVHEWVRWQKPLPTVLTMAFEHATRPKLLLVAKNAGQPFGSNGQTRPSDDWHRLAMRMKKLSADVGGTGGKVIVMAVDCSVPEITEHCARLSLADKDGASSGIGLYIVNSSIGEWHHGGLKYKLDVPGDDSSAFKLPAMKQFVEDALAHKIAPFFKSSIAVAKKQNHERRMATKADIGFAWELDGRTFYEKIVVAKANAFVLFYAPYCKFSRESMPLLQAVARMLKSFKIENTLLAMMDGTTNDIAHRTIKVERYPSLWFVDSFGSATEYTVPYRSEDLFVHFTLDHIRPSIRGTDADPRFLNHSWFSEENRDARMEAARKAFESRSGKDTKFITPEQAANEVAGMEED
jgi:thiol-disulfide isomerase/thioredoxin